MNSFSRQFPLHTHRFMRLCALPLAALFILPLCAYAQDEVRSRRTTTSVTPTVTITSDVAQVTLCAEDAARANSRVRLTTATSGFNAARYTWTTTGGRITEDGTSAIWDLTDAAPGAYIASLEVDGGTDGLCRAFTSTTVVARPCAPTVVRCPTITLNCPDELTRGTPLPLVVNVSGAPANVTPTFTWTVTGGNIVGGQGTSEIAVDLAGYDGGSFTATVNVGGFDQTCPATASCTTTVAVVAPTPTSRKFDEFPSISFDDDKARLDNFAVELQSDPTARGFIVVHPGRRSRADQAARLGERARNYLTNVRGIDANRLTVVGGDERERPTYQLYIVPIGATPPPVGR